VTVCAICEHLALTPRASTGSVGLLTNAPGIVALAIDDLGISAGTRHVVVPACPEHVVDVYRGRIEGVRMAWRLGQGEAAV
jgi:hypothetical protein